MSNLYFNRIMITLMIFCLLLLSWVIYKQSQQGNIAYIDSGKVMGKYKGVLQARALYEEENEHYKSRLDTLIARVKLDITKMEELKGKGRNVGALLDSVNIHKRQFKNYQQAGASALHEKEASLTRMALERLNRFLVEYGKKEGYSLILIASPAGTIAYGENKLDISETVIEAANKAL